MTTCEKFALRGKFFSGAPTSAKKVGHAENRITEIRRKFFLGPNLEIFYESQKRSNTSYHSGKKSVLGGRIEMEDRSQLASTVITRILTGFDVRCNFVVLKKFSELRASERDVLTFSSDLWNPSFSKRNEKKTKQRWKLVQAAASEVHRFWVVSVEMSRTFNTNGKHCPIVGVSWRSNQLQTQKHKNPFYSVVIVA